MSLSTPRLVTLGFAMALTAVNPAALAVEDGAARHAVIQAFGADQFDKIEAIRFTFHVHREAGDVMRAWQWWPGKQDVSVTTTDAQGNRTVITYNRAELTGEVPPDVARADRWFINDSYWLLTGVHVAWSDEARVTDHGKTALPIGDGQGRKLTITYRADGGGYTPGDAYDLYLNDAGRVVQWAFWRDSADKPTMVNQWTEQVTLGPLKLSLARLTPDGTPRITFEDVAAKRVGEQTWIKPQPIERPVPVEAGAPES